MKKILSFTLIFAFAFTFFSCLKENHKLRFQNNFHDAVNNLVVGSANIGNVGSGQASAYVAINTGNFTISGTSASGQSLTGGGTISGKGTHKWTLTLSAAGQVSIAEDK